MYETRKSKKIITIIFGSIPPNKILPNLSRSIIYIILFLGFVFLEAWAEMEKIYYLGKFSYFCALIILFVIEFRAIYSYYLLANKFGMWVVEWWYKIKWNVFYSTVSEWLIVTNFEKAKGWEILDLLNKRGILRETSKIYESMKETNEINSFEMYGCLRRDISNLDVHNILDIKYYLQSSYRHEATGLLKNSITLLFPILIFIMAYLSGNGITLSSSNTKIILSAKSTKNLIKGIIALVNSNQFIELILVFSVIVFLLIVVTEFLVIKKENRIERMLKSIVEEILDEKA